MREVHQWALEDAASLTSGGVDGLIIENFNDVPFYKNLVPAETVAAMSVIAKSVIDEFDIPIGINVLRNDANAALGIAVSTGASFVRINVHMHAMLTDQGIIEGHSYDTLRKRSQLNSKTLIFADIYVKHAHALVTPHLGQWTEDLTNRGMADAVIVTGSGTGKQTALDELDMVKAHTDKPVLIGSGLSVNSIKSYLGKANGAIVGSAFKVDGRVANRVDRDRVKELIDARNQ